MYESIAPTDSRRSRAAAMPGTAPLRTRCSPKRRRLNNRKPETESTDAPQVLRKGTGPVVDRRQSHAHDVSQRPRLRPNSTRTPQASKSAITHVVVSRPLLPSSLSSSKSSRTSTSLPLPSQTSAPLDCDPTTTANIWRAVEKRLRMPLKEPPRYLNQTVASSKRLDNSRNPSNPTLPVSVESITASRSTTSHSPSETASSRNKNKLVRVIDANFRQTVLARHGIILRDIKDDLRSPYAHFGTPDPEGDDKFSGTLLEWYHTKHHHTKDSKVWLSLDETKARDIATEYQAMNRLRENEAAFSYYGKSSFFKMDKRILPESELRVNTTRFMLEWGPKPDDKNLYPPPQVNGPELTQPPFAFNMKPDCTYWLTLCRMNPRYRSMASRLTYTLPQIQAMAPYLTIEFKKDDQDYEVAENQLAASVAVILYNRVRLRCDRLQACQTPRSNWSGKHFADIKHYAIGFNGSQARIYRAYPNLTFAEVAGEALLTEQTESEHPANTIWKGCRLDDFSLMDAQRVDGVLSLQEWVNEIHCWGLGAHSEQVIFDIKGILARGQGGLDRVSLDRETLVEWGLAPETDEAQV